MDASTIKKILELNSDFYKKVSEDFDLTRQSDWLGWNRVGDNICKHFKKEKSEQIRSEIKLPENKKPTGHFEKDKKESISTDVDLAKEKKPTRHFEVLDLGCGNGRFYEFLDKNFDDFFYTGLDNNSDLIKKAVEKFGHGLFHKKDIFSKLYPDDKFDLIVCFGITHHIPGKDFRLKWFENLSRFMYKDGLLVLTFWNYHDDERFKNAVRGVKTGGFSIKEEELEEGDYFLGWGKNKDAFRFYHKYVSDEIFVIDEIFRNCGFDLVDTFESDGKSGWLNTYKIYKKITD